MIFKITIVFFLRKYLIDIFWQEKRFADYKGLIISGSCKIYYNVIFQNEL